MSCGPMEGNGFGSVCLADILRVPEAQQETVLKRKWWRAVIYVALALVCVVALAAPLYNRQTPRLFGVPFFIWFQMVWVVVAAIVTAVALRAAKGEG